MRDNELDTAYLAYLQDPSSAQLLDDLMVLTRKEVHSVIRDDDGTQDACTFILRSISEFKRENATSFGRWISRIAMYYRMSNKRSAAVARARVVDAFSDLAASGDAAYFDISQFPDKLRVIAEGILRGESVPEIASRLGTPVATLRKRLRYFKETHQRVAHNVAHAGMNT